MSICRTFQKGFALSWKSQDFQNMEQPTNQDPGMPPTPV